MPPKLSQGDEQAVTNLLQKGASEMKGWPLDYTEKFRMTCSGHDSCIVYTLACASGTRRHASATALGQSCRHDCLPPSWWWRMATLSEKTELACWLARQVQVLVGASLLWCSGLLSCWNSKTGLHLEWLSSDYVDPLCGADVKPAIKCLLEPAGSWVGRPRCALNGIYFIVLLSAPPLPSLVTSPYPSQHMAALLRKPSRRYARLVFWSAVTLELQNMPAPWAIEQCLRGHSVPGWRQACHQTSPQVLGRHLSNINVDPQKRI